MSADPGGTFDEKRIILTQSTTGSGNTAAKGFNKLGFQFVGKGIIDGDKAKFVPNNFTTDDDCGVGGENAVAGMQGADVNAEGELLVGFYGNDVSFNVASPVGKPYKLCYFFTQINSYMIFQAITMEVKDVETLTLARGDPTSMIVGAAKNVTLAGPGVASGLDTFKFVSHTVTTDAGCNSASNVTISGTGVRHDNLVHVNDGGGNITNASTVTTALTFNDMSPSTSEPFKLCYKFQGEEFKLYSALTILAKDLSQITANGEGTGSVAVVDVEKNFTFEGTGVATHDTFFWISHAATSSAECVRTGPLALSSVQSPSRNASSGVFSLTVGSARLTFTNRTMVGKPHRLCYRFGPLEPYKLYLSKTVTVKDIIAVVTSVGDPDIAVRRAVKTLSFMGTGISVHDQVLWISGEADRSANCTTSMNATGMDHNKIALTTTDGFYQDSGTVTLAFEQPSPVASLGYKLCFKFGLEPYKLYHDFRVYTKDFLRIVATEGSSSVALAGADFSKAFAFEGDGLASGDRVKFVANEVFTDAGCEIAVAQGGVSGPDAAGGMVLISTAADPDTRVSFTHDLLFSQPSPEGSPFKVCYKFKNEPFKLYDNVLMSAKQLSSIAANVGSSTTAVVGYGKTFTLGGSGLSSGDTFAFVKDTTVAEAEAATTAGASDAGTINNVLTHDTCETVLAGSNPNNAAVLMLSQEATQNVTSYRSAGNFIIFGEASGPTSVFRLCYKFTGEKAVLLKSTFPFEVLQISGVTAPVGLSTVAVKGIAKTFTFAGADVGSENRAKWVPSSVTSDAGCSGATQVTNTGGSSGEVVVGSSQGVGTAQATFTTASLRNDNFHLCFRFGNEPYKLYTSFALRVKELAARDVESLLVGSPTEVTFSGNYVSDWIFGDKYGAGVSDTAKWVAAGDSCSMNPVGGSTLRKVVRAPCTTTKACASAPTGKATFNFSTPSPVTVPYELCYRFGLEDFAKYAALSVNAVAPEITYASTSTAVVGQTKLVTFGGTLGLTTGDVAKFVPGDGNCSMAGQGGMADVAVTITSEVDPVENTVTRYSGSANFTFATATPETSLWRLCYRFGLGQYIMFPAFAMATKEIKSASFLAGTNGAAAGSALTFTFVGTGISRAGDKAKWVSNAAAADADCATAPPIAGSTEMSVDSNGRAAFNFTSGTDGMKLCYTFFNETARLYTNLPIVEEGVEVEEVVEENQVDVALTLTGSVDEIPPGSEEEVAFKDSFTSDISAALGIDSSRVQILEILSGSIIVNFRIIPSTDGTGLKVEQAVNILEEQISEPDSDLYSGSVTSKVDSEVPLAVTFTPAPPVTVATSNATNATATSGTSSGTSSGANAGASAGASTASSTGSTAPTALIPVQQSMAALAITPFQPSGLFSLEKSLHVASEDSGTLRLKILRTMGTSGTVRLQVFSVDGTAIGGLDFDAVNTIVVFGEGETQKTVDIKITDDAALESHYEKFQVYINLLTGTENARLGKYVVTTVHIYDYGEGTRLANSSFTLVSGSGGGGTTGNGAGSEGAARLLQGWSITDNGKNKAYVDPNGLYAVDEVVAQDEYNHKCDVSATTPCTYSCEFGGGYSTTSGKSEGILELDGSGYVVTDAPFGDFPTDQLTITMWVRASQIAPHGKRALLSYVSATENRTNAYQEFAIYDVSALSVVVAGRAGLGLANSVEDAKSSVRVDDGYWHFIAVTWRKAGGELEIYKDGKREFVLGAYRSDVR